MLKEMGEGLNDLRAGLRRWPVWVALAGEDIGDQHRRTTLGPIWLLINYLAFAGTFIFVFRQGDPDTNYPAHAATGLLVWFYVMEVISQSVTLFPREESFIKGTSLPLSVYVFRLAMQSVIRASYALVGAIAIIALSGHAFALGWGWSLLGILLILVTTPAAIISFALVGTYFPDSQFLISNMMRIGMFLTPVFWVHGSEGGVRGVLYYWNPFTYFVEIVRAPILTGQLPVVPLAVCGTLTALLWIVSLYSFGKRRHEVVFTI